MDKFLVGLQAIVNQSAGMYWDLIPYVLLGAFLGALLRRMDRIPFLDSLGTRHPRALLFAASGLGTVSPLCTMGTVPLLAGMLGRGLPIGPVAGFLVASSMANPQILVLTAGTVGVPLAVTRWLAAVAVGVSVGWLADLAHRRGWRIFSSQAKALHDQKRHECPGRRRSFLPYFLDQLQFIALHLLIGVLLAAALNVFVPQSFLLRWLGAENRFAVVLSSLLAIPFYVCGGGILPTMQALMEQGVPGGVILAFFISGPATRVQALAALSAFLSVRALLVYVSLVLFWAVLLGMTLNHFTVHP